MTNGTDAVFGPEVAERAREIIAQYPQSRSALLPLLHLVQSVQGWVSPDGVAFCARLLDLSAAEVDAVVTFYTMYKRRPCGEHLVSVCTNTLCAVLGGDSIYARLREFLGSNGNGKNGTQPVEHEETFGEPGTPGSITLEHVECLAACDLGPVVQVNYEYFDNQTVDSAVHLVDALRRGDRPAPDRGAPLTDFKTAERQLAGVFDNLESDVDGPSAAPETVRGAALAVDRGWTAPAMTDTPLPPVPVKSERK
ncbi:MAG TPA: NAD(P)H-dependent oxidoreductase subunit E [Pseudonocardiaceae bacterium]|jgi:NADH-quinone oxidoreductase subunit E|nr:NAD(P)H-dependent oxidoreductase subunit E [Pseudonocardiaceae bacterium]